VRILAGLEAAFHLKLPLLRPPFWERLLGVYGINFVLGEIDAARFADPTTRLRTPVVFSDGRVVVFAWRNVLSLVEGIA
jgi:hypothetical protein